MTFDAATSALGNLLLGQRRQIPGGRPSFLVGTPSQIRSHQFDGR